MAYPSTFLDLQEKVIAKAVLDASLDRAFVKDWINRTYTQICVETEAVVTTATMTMTASAASYTLPAGVARVQQMVVKPPSGTQYDAPMVLTTLDEILNRRQLGGDVQQAPARSTHYALLGKDAFEVWPTPAAADVITVYYAAFPTALSADADLPVIEEPYASNLLEYGALVQAGDFKGDPATASWESSFSSWMGRYVQQLKDKRGVMPGQFHQWGDGWDSSSGGMIPNGY